MGALILGLQSKSWSLGACSNWGRAQQGPHRDREAITLSVRRQVDTEGLCSPPESEGSDAECHRCRPLALLVAKSLPPACAAAGLIAVTELLHTLEASTLKWGGLVHRRGNLKAPQCRPLQGRESLHWWVPGFQNPLATRTAQHRKAVVTVGQKMQLWWLRGITSISVLPNAAAEARTFLSSLLANPSSHP